MEWFLKLIGYAFAALVLVLFILLLIAGVVGISRYIIGY